MFHLHRHRKLYFKKTTELSLGRLIASLGLAAVDTVWAIYMSLFGFSDSLVGFISAFLVIISLLFSFYSTIILEKLGEYKVLLWGLFLTGVSYLIVGYYDNVIVFLIFSLILTLATVLRLESFDILFRDESTKRELNSNEALMYSLLNIGWFIGPLIAGFILAKYGISMVFMVSSLFIFLTFLIFLKIDPNLKKKNRDIIDSNIFNNIRNYIKDKKLRIPYLVAGGVEIWWALIYIYTPLFILDKGLGEEIVGFFLAAVTIPLILAEVEVGKMSEKFGFKKFIASGFFLLGSFAIACFFLDNMYLILVILVLASFAMSFIEPLQDSYFFNQLKRSTDEEKFYPIYSTATDFGSFIGKFSIATILLFLHNSYAYLMIGFLMCVLGIISLKIKE